MMLKKAGAVLMDAWTRLQRRCPQPSPALAAAIWVLSQRILRKVLGSHWLAPRSWNSAWWDDECQKELQWLHSTCESLDAPMQGALQTVPCSPRTPERKPGVIPVLESPDLQQLQRSISVSESEDSDVFLSVSTGNMVDNEPAQPHLGCMIFRFFHFFHIGDVCLAAIKRSFQISHVQLVSGLCRKLFRTYVLCTGHYLCLIQRMKKLLLVQWLQKV